MFCTFRDSGFRRAARRSPRRVVIHTRKGCNNAGGENHVALRVMQKGPATVLQGLTVVPLRSAPCALYPALFAITKCTKYRSISSKVRFQPLDCSAWVEEQRSREASGGDPFIRGGAAAGAIPRPLKI